MCDLWANVTLWYSTPLPPSISILSHGVYSTSHFRVQQYVPLNLCGILCRRIYLFYLTVYSFIIRSNKKFMKHCWAPVQVYWPGITLSRVWHPTHGILPALAVIARTLAGFDACAAVQQITLRASTSLLATGLRVYACGNPAEVRARPRACVRAAQVDLVICAVGLSCSKLIDVSYL